MDGSSYSIDRDTLIALFQMFLLSILVILLIKMLLYRDSNKNTFTK